MNVKATHLEGDERVYQCGNCLKATFDSYEAEACCQAKKAKVVAIADLICGNCLQNLKDDACQNCVCIFDSHSKDIYCKPNSFAGEYGSKHLHYCDGCEPN